jgi:hypothetical protein
MGLSLLRPYVRGMTPVVLVHGLWAGPSCWRPMIEALAADPEIDGGFQFWTFGYPTANPIPYSAYLLRRDLDKVRGRLDPDRTDPAFDRMVLVGHSMGGLLVKMVAARFAALNPATPARLWFCWISRNANDRPDHEGRGASCSDPANASSRRSLVSLDPTRPHKRRRHPDRHNLARKFRGIPPDRPFDGDACSGYGRRGLFAKTIQSAGGERHTGGSSRSRSRLRYGRRLAANKSDGTSPGDLSPATFLIRG